MMLILPIIIIPLYIFNPKCILIIQYFILFLTVCFSLLFFSALEKYFSIKKILRKEKISGVSGGHCQTTPDSVPGTFS